MLDNNFMKSRFIFMLALWAVLSNLLIIAEVAASEQVAQTNEKQVYEFTERTMRKILSRTGYRDLLDDDVSSNMWDHLSRNADGTSIRLMNGKKKRALVFSCDGSVKHIALPNFNTWLDNNNNIIAWPDNSEQNAIKDLNGHALAAIGAMDPSGQYFISYFRNEYFAILSVAKPDIPLARLKIIHQDSLSMFLKGDKLYVFGYDNMYALGTPPKAFVYEKDGASFRLVEEFEIQRPSMGQAFCFVEDMSPWSDEILLFKVYNFPSSPRRYIFNFKTKELKSLSPAKGRGLFLKCDILEKVEQRKR